MAGKDDPNSTTRDELYRLNSQFNQYLHETQGVKEGIAVLNVTVKGHGEKIDKLDRKVEKIDEKVSGMREQWQGDARDIVEACQARRDEISQAVDLTKERERDAARRYKPRSLTPTDPVPRPEKVKNPSWLRSAADFSLRVLLPVVVVASLSIGVGMAYAQCGSGEAADLATLKETKHTVDQLKKLIEDGKKDKDDAPLP